MLAKIKQNQTYKSIKVVIISLILLFFWIGLTFYYIFSFDKSFLVVSYNHSKENFKDVTYEKLLKNDKISGEFEAGENNLGILSVRFQTYKRPAYKDEDKIIFRIKEKGQNKWYYENTYRSGLIYDVPFFPFGFPKISESKGKIYEYEIQSLKGTSENALSIRKVQPIVASKYQYSKEHLLNDKKELLIFLWKKIINAFQTIDVLFTSFVFLLPFIFYLFFSTPFGNVVYKKEKHILKSSTFINRTIRLINVSIYKINANKYVISTTLLLFLVLFDIFYLELGNGMLYIVITSLWIYLQQKKSKNISISFLIGFILLFIVPIILAFKIDNRANQTAAWAYLFFVAGIVHALIEKKTSKK